MQQAPNMPDMIEGTEAFTRFREALQAVLKVPKSALPPNPLKQPTKKKPATPKS